MRSSVRQKRWFFGSIGCLILPAFFNGGVQAQSPAKEISPFDWLRHDAAPTNRAAGPTNNPPIESLNDQKSRQQIQPAVDEAPAMEAAAPMIEPAASFVEPALESAPPSPISRPVAHAANHPAVKTKTPQVVEQVDVTNHRSVTLNELKLVSLKSPRKPIVLRPSLKAGKSLKVDIPAEWGCLFLIWTQFSEEPSEQYDGVDLCADKKINLID